MTITKKERQQYRKVVLDRIGRRWYALMRANMAELGKTGTVTVYFLIDRSGHVTLRKTDSSRSTAILTRLSEQAVRGVELPFLTGTLAAHAPIWFDFHFSIAPE